MAIEPLGGIMSVQAQMAAPKPAAPVANMEKPEVNTESSAPKAERVDQNTAVVENAQAKGQSGYEEQQEQGVSNEQVKKAVEKLNKSMLDSEAIFGIHEGTNRVTIKIVDKETKEVIKELPPEKTLDMIAKAWEMAGILVDEKR